MGRETRTYQNLLATALGVLLLVIIGCGAESSNQLPTSLNNCAGEVDTDQDGICDKFDPDVNNPDLDNNNLLDGPQLTPLSGPSSTGGGSSGSGSVQPSGSGASTGNQLLTLAALAVLPRGSRGVSKFIGDTVFPEDDGSGSQGGQASGSPSGTGASSSIQTPAHGGLQSADVSAAEASMNTHTVSIIEAGQSLDPFINIAEDESFFYVLPLDEAATACPSVANTALITYVKFDYVVEDLNTVTHEFVSILLADLPEDANGHSNSEPIKNVGVWQEYQNQTTRLWINPEKRTYENARDVIENVKNLALVGIENCNATGYYHSTVQQGSTSRWNAADETFFGFEFEEATGLFFQESMTPFKLAFDPTQLDVFLKKGASPSQEEQEQPVQMATYIDPNVPTFWNRFLPLPNGFSIDLPWQGQWTRPTFE